MKLLLQLLHACDAALTGTGRYFLLMAGTCLVGIAIVYLGLWLKIWPLVALGLLLGLPFWLWSIAFLLLFYSMLAIAIPVLIRIRWFDESASE
jgi:hypothetical protein